MKMRQIRKRVGVIMGGTSNGREASQRAGTSVAEVLEARGYEVVRILLGESFGAEVGSMLMTTGIDVAFIALSGRRAEDGCIQGLLELAQIPYTGSGVLASALSMDKLKAKELFRLHNVPTPPYYSITTGDLDNIDGVHGYFGYPAVVKPCGESGGTGVTKVCEASELARAVNHAFEYDDMAVVERFVAGTEINVGILDGQVLGAVEIVPKGGDNDKIGSQNDDCISPSRLTPARYRGVLNLALRAAQAVGASGACLVDVIVTAGENEYVLEVNTMPVLTPSSLFAKIASAAGYGFGDLCESLLEGARLNQPVRRRPAIRPGSGVESRMGAVREQERLRLLKVG